MSSKKLHDIFESNLNELMNNEQNHAPSMRYLSTCIGASGGYIQKILSGDTMPSMDKLEAIGEHYDVEVWTLLYDYSDTNRQLLPIIQQLNRLPEDELPVVAQYLQFLIDQNHNKS